MDPHSDGFPAEHPAVASGKTGLLLINLGTPEAPTRAAVRRYLKEFLSDRRIIELPPLLWQPILRGIILNTRPGRVAKIYARIWDRQTDESPLRRYTRQQSEKLQAELGEGVVVDWAMRYGQPSIESRITALHDQGCERIALIALYPHYSGTTTASVYDKAFEALKRMRWQPAIRTAAPWHDWPVYIDALAESIQVQIDAQGWQPEVTLASFHGIPKRYFDKGDPYYCQCAKTTRLLREALGWSEDQLELTFQSRFGLQAWLQPYTEPRLVELAKQGVKNAMVISPGFISDCIETLDELGVEARHAFRQAGGQQFSLVPCLNDLPEGMKVLTAVARQALSGWVQ